MIELTCGFRSGEVASLQWQDCRPVRGVYSYIDPMIMIQRTVKDRIEKTEGPLFINCIKVLDNLHLVIRL